MGKVYSAGLVIVEGEGRRYYHRLSAAAMKVFECAGKTCLQT